MLGDMNKDEELFYLKIALSDYRLAYWFGWLISEFRFGTETGLCRYFSIKNQADLDYFDTLNDVALKKEVSTRGYWFPKGKLGPRIEILKEAIKEIEK